MNNYPEIFRSFAWRLLFALPFFTIGITGTAFVFSPFFTVAGAIIVASPLARFIAEPAGELFYPIKRSSKPAPMYSIPQAKRAKGLYEEAMVLRRVLLDACLFAGFSLKFGDIFKGG